MAFALEEDLPRKSRIHEIGQDLSTLSLDELEARIETLKAEIERIETARDAKTAQRMAADRFFRA